MAQAACVALTLAPAPLHRLRCAADDVEARPQAYADLFAAKPALHARVVEFAQAWRSAGEAIGMCALMARRSPPANFDALAFLRLVGRDVRERPAAWARLVQSQPRFADDSASLAQSLRDALATETPTAYA